uniref:Uncharacterized protein n=1 Tax=Timema tahoe TaxID=61484 RepID=A0A7R9IM47_9NEOP|nr:unnamed protein product [Timema tahoe]
MAAGSSPQVKTGVEWVAHDSTHAIQRGRVRPPKSVDTSHPRRYTLRQNQVTLRCTMDPSLGGCLKAPRLNYYSILSHYPDSTSTRIYVKSPFIGSMTGILATSPRLIQKSDQRTHHSVVDSVPGYGSRARFPAGTVGIFPERGILSKTAPQSINVWPSATRTCAHMVLGRVHQTVVREPTNIPKGSHKKEESSINSVLTRSGGQGVNLAIKWTADEGELGVQIPIHTKITKHLDLRWSLL